MKPQRLAECAAAMQTLLTQIIHSSQALSTDDPDVLADIEGREGGRLRTAIGDFFATLGGLADACRLVTDGEVGAGSRGPTACLCCARNCASGRRPIACDGPRVCGERVGAVDDQTQRNSSLIGSDSRAKEIERKRFQISSPTFEGEPSTHAGHASERMSENLFDTLATGRGWLQVLSPNDSVGPEQHGPGAAVVVRYDTVGNRVRTLVNGRRWPRGAP